MAAGREPDPEHRTPVDDETPEQRVNRNWNELLQELRVSQTGVQILFAFLLGLGFTGTFREGTTVDRVLYFTSLLSTAAATGMLIAPVAQHRLLFRRRRRPELVSWANSMALAGLLLIAIAIVTAVALVTDVVLGGAWAGGFAAAVALWLGLWWVVFPLSHRERHTDHEDPPAA